MEFDEATLFLGNNPGIANKLPDGRHDPKTFKMLRIEKIGPELASQSVKEKDWECLACGKDLLNKAAYTEHVSSAHTAQFVDEDVRDEVIAKKRVRAAKGVTNDSSRDRDSVET